MHAKGPLRSSRHGPKALFLLFPSLVPDGNETGFIHQAADTNNIQTSNVTCSGEKAKGPFIKALLLFVMRLSATTNEGTVVLSGKFPPHPALSPWGEGKGEGQRSEKSNAFVLVFLCLWCGRSRLSCRFPVVEVMGDPVTIAAFRELCHNALWMFITVAILAFGHGLVFVLMTECAVECSMLRFRRCQKVVGILVAGRAQFIVRILRIGNILGHMGLMALQTVSRHHIGGMGLVALRACRYLAVNVSVTGGAVQSGVFALILPKLLDLRSVARKTGLCQIFGE